MTCDEGSRALWLLSSGNQEPGSSHLFSRLVFLLISVASWWQEGCHASGHRSAFQAGKRVEQEGAQTASGNQSVAEPAGGFPALRKVSRHHGHLSGGLGRQVHCSSERCWGRKGWASGSRWRACDVGSAATKARIHLVTRPLITGYLVSLTLSASFGEWGRL